MGATFEAYLAAMLVVMALPTCGAETTICSFGLLPGGNQGQGSTLLVDGMFGSSADEAGTGTVTTLRGGEAGQLYDAVGLTASSPSTNVPETTSCPLSAISINDDGSYTGIDAVWTVLDGPLVEINSNGLALAGTVYQNTPALVGLSGCGLTGTVSLLVLDTLKDNYGLYAADNIMDSWQVGYFGVENTNGLAAADGDQDRANNYAEFVAGTSPLNGLEVFRITSLRRQAAGRSELVMAPAFSNRTYHVEAATNLVSPTWFSMATTNGPTLTTQLVFADIPATNPVTFYRASIDYEW